MTQTSTVAGVQVAGTTQKQYRLSRNIGSSKYVVDYADGIKCYKDTSIFWDIQIFSNKSKANTFVKSLMKEGYKGNGLFQ